eukprot:scaffold18015_cov83-Cylindrotheca_fusiformis.AAC.2
MSKGQTANHNIPDKFATLLRQRRRLLQGGEVIEKGNPPCSPGKGGKSGPTPAVLSTHIHAKGMEHQTARTTEEKRPKAMKGHRGTRKEQGNSAIPKMSRKSRSIRLGSLGRQKRKVDPVVREPATQVRKPRATAFITPSRKWRQRSTSDGERGQGQRTTGRVSQLQEDAKWWGETQELHGLTASARGWGP